MFDGAERGQARTDRDMVNGMGGPPRRPARLPVRSSNPEPPGVAVTTSRGSQKRDPRYTGSRRISYRFLHEPRQVPRPARSLFPLDGVPIEVRHRLRHGLKPSVIRRLVPAFGKMSDDDFPNIAADPHADQRPAAV